jgi:hypothetical protein
LVNRFSLAREAKRQNLDDPARRTPGRVIQIL